jgi:hypothetical protein
VKGSCRQVVELEKSVKFSRILGKFASETFQMNKEAYSEEALGRSSVFKWHKRFAKQWRDSLEHDELTGWSRTAGTELKIQAVAMLVGANCCRDLPQHSV